MGATAMSADRDLQLLLVQLMDRNCALLLRGRAAVLLASLRPGAVAHNFTQVAEILQSYSMHPHMSHGSACNCSQSRDSCTVHRGSLQKCRYWCHTSLQ